MTTASHIISALRSGVVPDQGLALFATGLEALEAAVDEELAEVATGRGAVKWLRGDYGAGKTFAARHLCARARARQFVTAEVQISTTDTPLHQLPAVYRRLIERLETQESGGNGLADLVDDWLYRLSTEALTLAGLAEDSPHRAEATEQRLTDQLNRISARAPAFAQVLRAYYRAKNEGDHATAEQLLGWLAGQPHTASRVLARAGVKGKLDGQAALAFLEGLLLLVRQTGYRGLVVVLDEVETVQRLGAQQREKSLTVLRQLTDAVAAGQLPGLYLLVTGTREFFEGYKGVQALPPLAQRVNVVFEADARFDNLRAPQVRLQPFDGARLLKVGHRVRALYPAKHPARVAAKVTDAFLEGFVRQRGDEVLPRVFLRELVDVLDKVDQHEAWTPPEYEVPPSDQSPPVLSEPSVLSERSRGRGRERATHRPPKPKRLED